MVFRDILTHGERIPFAGSIIGFRVALLYVFNPTTILVGFSRDRVTPAGRFSVGFIFNAREVESGTGTCVAWPGHVFIDQNPSELCICL